MPGSLLPINFSHQYNTLFTTIERDPAIKDLSAHKDQLVRIFREQLGNDAKLTIACEISGTGYHHDHVLTYTPTRRKISKRFHKQLQATFGYTKVNKSKISVAFHHPRRGSSDDYASIQKYLTESKHKPKQLDTGVLMLHNPTSAHFSLRLAFLKANNFDTSGAWFGQWPCMGAPDLHELLHIKTKVEHYCQWRSNPTGTELLRNIDEILTERHGIKPGLCQISD